MDNGFALQLGRSCRGKAIRACFAAQILEMIPDYVLTTINLSDLKNLRILYFVTFAKYVNAGTGCDMYF